MAAIERATTERGHQAISDGRLLEHEAFDAFPYGLLVLDRAGHVLSRNREAARLIQSMGGADGKLTCCSLLGCKVPGTVLELGCLTELALDRDAVLPEMRVDVRSRSGPAAMWVVAAPLAGKGVVVQLRPGISGDRRRRTSPHWMAGPRLRIHTLGNTVVESMEGPIGGAWLDQRTGQLLKYLVAERRRAVTVDEIGESIWSQAEYDVRTSVRYYVHTLRRKLEPARGQREPSAFVVSRSGTYRLDLSHVEIDADEFETRVRAGLTSADGDPLAGANEIERGLAIYRGDFLADMPYAEWAIGERHRLHDLACIGLSRLADIRLSGNMLDGAARALERLAALQPFDEDVHRRLIEVDVVRGRRSDAVRRYATLRSRLRKTFRDGPSFTLADISSSRTRD
jgi:DNA-binding SARP family transcriptional activator